jgi:hypothetical protein
VPNLFEPGAANDFDVFFFYGSNDLQLETESDLVAGLIQEKRSLFYNRQDAAGLKENYPNTFTLSVSTKYDITSWVSFRNTQVTDGTNSTRDRRVAVSQNYISFSRESVGTLNVEVLYIPFYNFKKAQQLTIPVSGGI